MGTGHTLPLEHQDTYRFTQAEFPKLEFAIVEDSFSTGRERRIGNRQNPKLQFRGICLSVMNEEDRNLNPGTGYPPWQRELNQKSLLRERLGHLGKLE